ncbi:MAG TPA: hypothetical protein VEV84_12710 [Pyrinomonadaceae bacterium]|jgi:hypothetical protein|nr:hypothetical protein [Pyrinomonadaceae bacterium]
MPETAQDRLKKMAAADVEPTLTDDEIDALLVPCCLKDKEGRAPTDIDWTPTYDLNSAAASAWMIKAARASATVEVDPPGSGIFTSKVFENCRAMARIYRAKCRLGMSMK